MPKKFIRAFREHVEVDKSLKNAYDKDRSKLTSIISLNEASRTKQRTQNRETLPLISSFSRRSLEREYLFEDLPVRVIDKVSLLLNQIFDLHKTADHTLTSTGSAVFFRSLANPATSLELILAKQEAVREIESDDKLSNAIEQYLKTFANQECYLYRFLNGHIDTTMPYKDIKLALKAGENIVKAAGNIPRPKSKYLNMLLGDIEAFENDSSYQLMRGPIYRTLKGLTSEEDKPSWMPRMTFYKSRATPYTLFMPGILITELAGRLTGVMSEIPKMPIEAAPIIIGGIFATIFYTLGKPEFDFALYLNPLREKLLGNDAFINAIESVGRLDEILSAKKFGQELRTNGYDATLPTVTGDEYHIFQAKNLRNPILTRILPSVVPNDVMLDGQRITEISGPNSGGKTTLGKGIEGTQLLGQAGTYVCAFSARMSVADRIAYQAPLFDSLQDEEGRFGTEMRVTQSIFYTTTPRSLIVLDELSEGTTTEAKLEISYDILRDFYTIGNNLILITHNHQLIDKLQEKGMGKCLQVEFKDDKPTHRFIEGISRESHAYRVLEKIGFSKEHRQRYLEHKGYKR